jgi:hypothetical protein
MSKYFLAIGAMFKNEAHSIEEWLKHYIYHGVDHFYLINDKSTDNTVEIIQPYIDKGLITLFSVDEPYYLGRQRNLYNKHVLPLIKETQWLLMIDLDEYVWSKKDVSLPAVLRTFETYGQIQLTETVFGSKGLATQPDHLIPAFTRCEDMNKARDRKLKYFVNSDYEFTSLNIHHADFTNRDYMTNALKFIKVNRDYFCLNHYNCQTLAFWTSVKCVRGDADHYLVRTVEQFKDLDMNDVEDLELYKQNKGLYEKFDG